MEQESNMHDLNDGWFGMVQQRQVLLYVLASVVDRGLEIHLMTFTR